jgi:ATP-dependent DNA helicase PIF1
VASSEDAIWPEGIRPTGAFLATLDFVKNTRDNLFVTGRAGTGKSTLLRGIVRALDSQLVIAAPTGIAALNVGGETLHSLFRLPQGLLLDGEEERSSPRNIFEVDDLTLVIDEVSMVRSDVLNAIDLALRQQREIQTPFGGVRVIAFGDTHQLPPVVDHYEDERLKDAFGGAFFFHAPAASSMSMVELTEVFRQKDERFVALLNQIRDGCISDAALTELNGRVGSAPRQDAHNWVWLCTTNRDAAAVNRRFLDALPGTARLYRASVSGEFERASRPGRVAYSSTLPAETELALKEGARVIFIRNDRHRRWVNGTTGVVTSLDEDEIEVKTDGDDALTVGFDTWTKHKRIKVDKEVHDQEVGSMSQLPLRLGWAITIHKSQGMSLDRVVFSAPRSLFAPGQAYVGLSRARSLEGLRLLRPLKREDVFLSPDAVGYRDLLTPLSF